MPLTERQVTALETLDWLFDDRSNRAEGRTFIMAVAFIRQALRYPGRQVPIFDHIHSPDTRMAILGYAQRLVDQDPRLQRLDWNWHHDSRGPNISVGGMTPPEIIPYNWIPSIPEEETDIFLHRVQQLQDDEAIHMGPRVPNTQPMFRAPPEPEPEPPQGPPAKTVWERLSEGDLLDSV